MNKHFFRTWHRRIGISSMLMILWLAFSGMLINHSDALGLHKIKISSDLIRSLYGLKNSFKAPEALVINENYYFCFEGSLYQNQKILSRCDSEVLSGVYLETEKQSVLLTPLELIFLDENSNLLDRISHSLLGKNFEKLFVVNKQMLLQEQGQPVFWNLDLIQLNVTPAENLTDEIIGAQSNPLTELPKEIQETLGFSGVSIERILLDAHSGRLFGKTGVLFVDFFALAFVVLALSGLWIFVRQSR